MHETGSSLLSDYQGYQTAGNDRTSFLKSVALVFMIIDHAGILFFRNDISLRLLGRIAFPIYAWCIVVGMGFTRQPIHYSLRLFIMAIVSQFFYMRTMHHSISELNVLFTLLLGQLAILGIQYRRHGSQYWTPVVILLCTMLLHTDYGFRGVLLIVLLYLAKGSKAAICAVMIAFCLFWGEGTITVNQLFGIPLLPLKNLTANTPSLYNVIFRLQNFAVLSLVFIAHRIGWRKKMPVWLGYIAYPGHYIVLRLIVLALGQS